MSFAGREEREKFTPERIRQKKAAHDPIVCLTAYDYPMAKLVDASGVDMVLASPHPRSRQSALLNGAMKKGSKPCQ